jgi:hypothetical protein
MGGQHARDLDTLAFADGKSDAAFSNEGCEALWKAVEGRMQTRCQSRFPDLIVGSMGVLIPDVISQRSTKYDAVRRYYSDL